MNDNDLTQAVAELQKGLGSIEGKVGSIEGKLDGLAAKMELGDNQSANLVAVMQPTLSQLSEAVRELRAEIRDGRVEAAKEASAVRVDLERQLEVHRQEDAPHARTLGSRLTRLEEANAKERGARSVLMFAVPVVSSLIVGVIVAVVAHFLSSTG